MILGGGSTHDDFVEDIVVQVNQVIKELVNVSKQLYLKFFMSH